MTTSGADTAVFSGANIAKAFMAGFASVLVFQFGLAAILHSAGLIPNAPYGMAPVPPFGVPQTLSSAFWGGLWGIVFLGVLRGRVGSSYWMTAAIFGGIVVSAVALLIVGPIKGRPFAAGWNMRIWLTLFVLHAAFGLGTALLLRALNAGGRAR